MSTRKTKKRPAPRAESLLKQSFAAFERSEGPFYEGMKLLKAAQSDSAACAASGNLYSHALRALRHIAQRPCEAPSEEKNILGTTDALCPKLFDKEFDKEEDWCCPCYARHALRRGGDKE